VKNGSGENARNGVLHTFIDPMLQAVQRAIDLESRHLQVRASSGSSRRRPNQIVTAVTETFHPRA